MVGRLLSSARIQPCPEAGRDGCGRPAARPRRDFERRRKLARRSHQTKPSGYARHLAISVGRTMLF